MCPRGTRLALTVSAAALVVAAAAEPSRAAIQVWEGGSDTGSESGEGAGGDEEASPPEDEEERQLRIREVRQDLEEVQARIERLETELAELEEERSDDEQAIRQRLEETLKDTRTARDALEERLARLERFRTQASEDHAWLVERIKQAEEDNPTTRVDETPDGVVLGGAVWLNYAMRFWNQSQRARGGDFDFDLFRLSVDGSIGDILVSAQYRFYSFMHTVHHGWLGYDFSDDWQLRVGVTQVPFGILPYASHSYWFGIPYYLGFEDDYDVGARLIWDREPWNVQVAFFKNAEWGVGSNLDRYSFDVVAPADDGRRDSETNQINLRVTYELDHGDLGETKLGVSGQWGQLDNAGPGGGGQHWAAAGHLNGFYGPWNLQLQGIRYEFDAGGPPDTGDGLVTVGGFGASRSVADDGLSLVANLSRTFRIDAGPLKKIIAYEDFSTLWKAENEHATSWLSTTGATVVLGPVWTYIDLIVGRNAMFLNDAPGMSGLGPGGTDDPEVRLNASFEFFF